jgi:hypothetical protein
MPVVEATDLLRQAQRVGSLVLDSRPKAEVELSRVSPIGPTVTVLFSVQLRHTNMSSSTGYLRKQRASGAKRTPPD